MITVQDIDQSKVKVEGDVTTIIVQNTSGVTIPETGGEGTIPYVVGGSALMAMAGMLLALRKRLAKASK